MRLSIFFVISMIGLSLHAQTVRLGDVNTRNVIVVTQEVDSVAMAAIGVLTTNTVKVADTNGWQVGAHKAWLTNETDAAAMAAIGVLNTNTVKVAGTNGWETGAHLPWITEEQDALALAFAATNRVRTWVDESDPLIFWVEIGSTNRTKYTRVVSGTNLIVTLSAYFEEPDTHTRPVWTTNAFPFAEQDGFTGYAEADDAGMMIMFGSFESVWFAPIGTAFPAQLAPSINAIGTATVSIASFNYVTNVGPSYILTTGNVWQAINTAQATADDALIAAGYAQADISSHAPDGTIAAPHLILGDRALIDSVPGKAAITGGVMTNVTLIGTVNGTAYVPVFIGTTNELPIIANRTNGVLYVEVP